MSTADSDRKRRPLPFDGDGGGGKRPAVLDRSKQWVEYGGGAVQSWHRGTRMISHQAFSNHDDLTICRGVTKARSTGSGDVWTRCSNPGCPIGKNIRIRVAPNVAVIPARAFENCLNLKVVDLNNVSTISDKAFYNCNEMEHIVWPTTSMVEIGEEAFEDCCSLKEIELSNVKKVGLGAFHDCWGLKSVTIPPSVVEVGLCAFYECKALTKVELKEGIQRVGVGAFQDCSSLVRVSIPSSVTDIGEGVFQGCSSLAEVKLNEGLYRIEDDAFKGCNSLAHINIPPVALVINFESYNCQLMKTTMPVSPGRKLIVSKWLQYRSPYQLAQAQAKVWEILIRRQRTEEEKIQCIREWFAYYYLLDVTMMLELALWRANMDGNERDVEARQAGRRSCGNE